MDKYISNLLRSDRMTTRLLAAHQNVRMPKRFRGLKQPELAELLERLVGYRTVTANIPQNRKAITYIDRYLRRRGMKTQYAEIGGRPSLYAHTTDASNLKPIVLLAGHIDVIPAHDKAFRLQTTDDRYIGRGVLDMKFAIASYLKLVDDLRNELTTYDVGMLITSDEEIGGEHGVKAWVERGLQPTVCILPDGGFDWQIQTGSSGVFHAKLIAHGIGGHASLPWLGDNAIVKLQTALTSISALFDKTEDAPNTLNIGIIQGGKAVNQIPDHAEADIDIRYAKPEDYLTILARCEAVCNQHEVEFSVVLHGDATKFDLSNPFIQPFAQLIEAETGIAVHGMSVRGSNDARFLAPLQVPCISLYIPGANHHAEGEWIDKRSLEQFHTILGKYIRQFARHIKA